MADDLELRRRLRLSATELAELNVKWPEAMIEDYLAIGEELDELQNEVNTKNDIIKETTVVTFADSPYTPQATDEEIFYDTTDGPILSTLPAGIDGTNYRHSNVGKTGYKVTLRPALNQELYGEQADEYMVYQEKLIMTFDEILNGWN